MSIPASAARVCPSVQPDHHFRSATGAGPKARSQPRASSTRAGSASSAGTPAGNHASTVDHQYCPPEVHDPRGRPRTTRPSAASSGSTRDATLCDPWYDLPRATTIRPLSRGSSSDSSVDSAEPRTFSAATVASSTSASHVGTSSARPPSARNCTVLRRSTAAIALVHAACTTGTSSIGTTNMVRRMPRIRTSTRSS